MNLTLKRISKQPTYTIGRLYIDNTYFCDTLEDTDRGLSLDMPIEDIKLIKIPNETAIPTGEYRVVLSRSPRFKKVLPEILNVPGYTGVRIHSGNTAADSSGCILVGENKLKGLVVNSKKTVQKLMQVLLGLNEVILTIE